VNNSYPKTEKLKSKTLITKLFKEGKTITVFPIKLLYIKTQELDVPIKAGVTAPKRSFKSAVDRNHLKRLLRESYRLNKRGIFDNTEEQFALIFIYLGKEILDFNKVERKMILLLEKLKVRIHEKNPS